MWFLPRTEGAASIRSESEAFVRTFARRIEGGLLSGGSSTRNQYTVTREGRDTLSFRAANWLTAFNVGLNDVEMSVSAGQARYRIEYRRWAAYGVALSAVIGLALAVVLLVVELDQNVAIGWAMVIFWGFVWPWILIAMHKRPLRRLMTRLIEEVDASVRTQSVRPPSS